MTIESFKGKYKNKRAFMVGNGPSLKRTPLDDLQGEYSFAMNRISLLYEKVNWRPSFFICTTLNIEKEVWRRDIIKTISLGMPCFVWDKLKKYVAPYHFKNVYYINCTHGEKVTDKSQESWWSHDIRERVCKFGTSMLPALQIAVYMGFNPIYLLGCDLGFKRPRSMDQDVGLNTPSGQQPDCDQNHFDPTYDTPGCPPDVLNMNMTAAHKIASKATSSLNVEIKNATLGGSLEVFPRADLYELIRSRKSINETMLATNAKVEKSSLIDESINGADQDRVHKVKGNSVSINFIDVGSAGNMPEPWNRHEDIIRKKLCFEPREVETNNENRISISTSLWEKNGERNFFIYRGLNGSGSSLFLQNYEFVIENFDTLKSRGSKILAQSWLGRSLPVEVERVRCQTLDDVLAELNLSEKFHFIKIDSQGAEYQILKGGLNYLLNDCYGMQVELFTLPLYKGIKLFDEVVAYLNDLGFDLVKTFPPHGTFNSQCDCVFLKREIDDDVTHTIRGIYGLPDLQTKVQQRVSDINPTADSDTSSPVSLNDNRVNDHKTAAPFEQANSNLRSDGSAIRLSQYKDKHIGQRCVIIGNGPSLNRMDLSFLEDEITFGLNKIYLLSDTLKFTPTYYVSVNPLVIEQSADRITKIPSVKFIGLNGKKFFKKPSDLIFLKSIGTPSFTKDPRQGLWEGHTVTYVAMQLAYYMGFEEVILIGVDHNFQCSGKPNQEVVSKGEDHNHFHPDYFGEGVRWNLPDLERSEIAYRMAGKVFKDSGRAIIDATEGGKLNVFPKIAYKELFEKYRTIDQVSKKANCSEISYLIQCAKWMTSDRRPAGRQTA